MMKTPVWKLLLKLPLKLLVAGLIFFAVTFTIYFFNLDMKTTALVEPFLAKYFDSMPRKQYI